MNAGDVYASGKNLAYAQNSAPDAGSQIFTSVNVPLPSISGSLGKRDMARLGEHGFFVGGSVPRDDDTGLDEMGGFSMKHVKHAACSYTSRDSVCERRYMVHNHR